MRKIPNLLSLSRIPMSFALIFIETSNILWLLIYISIGITDVLDGYLSRRLNCTTDIGSILDSISDVIHLLCISYIIYYNNLLAVFDFSIFTPVLCLKVLSLLLGLLRFNRLLLIHTLALKGLGIAIFIFSPLIMLLTDMYESLILVIFVLSLFAALEELLIILTLSEPNQNIKSIFLRK